MQHNSHVEMEVDGALIRLPRDTVLRCWLASLNHQVNGTYITSTLEVAEAFLATPPALGQYWEGQGGIYAGIMRGENGQPDYHLIVPTHADAAVAEVSWGSRGEDEPSSTSSWDGKANTAALMKSKNSHPLVEFLKDLEVDGFSDFYIPSRREAALCSANCPEIFRDGWHWTSTQYSADSAFFQDFEGGYQYLSGKDNSLRVRAVRRFVIN